MCQKNPPTGCRTARAAAFSSFAVLCAGLAFAVPAAAQSSIPLDLSVAGAVGSRKQVKKVELDLGLTQPTPLWQGENWRIRLRHEFVLGEWRVPQASNITEFGYSPVFRLERPSGNMQYFAEASVGIRFLSHTWLSTAASVKLSTSFQFADMVGAGVQFGQGSGAQTVGLRVQHQSNADIKRPNPGINFLMLYYRYEF